MCQKNLGYILADTDSDASFVHVMGMGNQMADLLSRWADCPEDYNKLYTYIANPIWLPVNVQMLNI